MSVRLDAQTPESCLELFCQGLACKLSDYNAADIKTEFGESVDETKNFLIVSDAQVSPSLVLLNGIGIDRDNDLRIFGNALSILILLSGSKPGNTLDA